MTVKFGDLDAKDRAPLYVQLQRLVRNAIEDRRMSPEEAIPPERDIAEGYGVSRITVRRALEELVKEGLLTRRPGAGTFVAGQLDRSYSKLSSFSEDVRSWGRRPHSVWLKRSAGGVTPDEALSLGLSPGAAVFRFHRVRYADDAPMAIEYATIPAYCLPSLESVGDSLYDALARVGNRPVRVLQRLRAVLFTAEQSEVLKAAPNEAGLFIERRGYLRDGRAAELTVAYYRGDAYGPMTWSPS